MKTVLQRVSTALNAGESVVLCTIMKTAGSTPRNPGAKMAVFSDGSFVGTVGGGRVEYEALEQAKTVLTSGTSSVGTFCVCSGTERAGQVTVYFQILQGSSADHRARIAAMLECLEASEDSWDVTEIRRDAVWQCGVFSEDSGLRFLTDVDLDALRPWMTSRAALVEGKPSYLIEPLGRAGCLYILGGGHVSQALVPVLAGVGFRVVVLENRREFADQALFPTADQVVLTDFSCLQRMELSRQDGILIMTRGQKDDYGILRMALATDAGYVGVLGSRRKAQLTLKQLRTDGVPEKVVRRLHSPVGLPIGAETPEEIAIIVAAELIAHRAGMAGGR